MTGHPPNYISTILAVLDEELPGLDSVLAQLYALLTLTKGTHTTLTDVHDAWAVWTNTTRGHHKSLVPFRDLTPEVQELDREYRDGIHRAATRAQVPQDCVVNALGE